MGVHRRRVVVAVLSTVLLGAVLAGCGPGSDRGERQPREGVREPAPTECTGTLGAETVRGDLSVPEDETCRLRGTAVFGRVFVDDGASLLARSAYLGEGVSAHGFDRVEITGGKVPGRERDWPALVRQDIEKEIDFVFDGGRHVTVTSGYEQGHYYVLGTTGRVVVRGFYLDLGTVFCSGNRRPPEVSRISAEGVGRLQGQCAGLANFDPGSDF